MYLFPKLVGLTLGSLINSGGVASGSMISESGFTGGCFSKDKMSEWLRTGVSFTKIFSGTPVLLLSTYSEKKSSTQNQWEYQQLSCIQLIIQLFFHKNQTLFSKLLTKIWFSRTKLLGRWAGKRWPELP